jgi:hypothetical protein
MFQTELSYSIVKPKAKYVNHSFSIQLCNNIEIKIGNPSMHLNRCIAGGILYSGDLVDQEGNYYTTMNFYNI